MATLGPQTTTFTETVNAGASGTLTATNFSKAEATGAGSDPELFYIDTTNAGATAFAVATYPQKSGQKCLLQLDVVENDTTEGIGHDANSTATFQAKVKQLPELVRRVAASLPPVDAGTTNNTSKSVVKSVYVRVEYAESAKTTAA